jgi:hypothetical protein
MDIVYLWYIPLPPGVYPFADDDDDDDDDNNNK